MPLVTCVVNPYDLHIEDNVGQQLTGEIRVPSQLVSGSSLARCTESERAAADLHYVPVAE
jgi:hypothetical protein